MAKDEFLVEEAVTAKQVTEIVAQQSQLNFAPSEQGMHFTVTNGPFLTTMFTIPPAAMMAASKKWALFVKERADTQRAIQQVKRDPRLH